MFRLRFLFTATILCGCLHLLAPFDASAQLRIDHRDVRNFWKTYDLVRGTRDTLRQERLINDHYLRKASGPLKALLRIDSMDASSYVQRIRKSFARYEKVRVRTLEISKDDQAIRKLPRKYRALYPNFHQPAVAFVIGTFNRGGTTTRKYILIGAEVMALDKAASPLHTIAHELTHVQQNYRNGVDNEEEYKHLDLLGWAIMEGSCDFIAERLLGERPAAPYIAYGLVNEHNLLELFRKEMCGFRTDDWLYNGGTVKDKPADLGYFIGYAICKHYYQQAANKRKAIRDIIGLRYSRNEHHAFLEKAGYHP